MYIHSVYITKTVCVYIHKNYLLQCCRCCPYSLVPLTVSVPTLNILVILIKIRMNTTHLSKSTTLYLSEFVIHLSLHVLCLLHDFLQSFSGFALNQLV